MLLGPGPPVIMEEEEGKSNTIKIYNPTYLMKPRPGTKFMKRNVEQKVDFALCFSVSCLRGRGPIGCTLTHRRTHTGRKELFEMHGAGTKRRWCRIGPPSLPASSDSLK